ncbi:MULTISPECIES: sirohydrochlorin chelatase [Mammaliicoccus]|uniref:sirohydrochlorin chelatase n=1 Tax=Mammaliicoccus TaxID=2803850 RepID=UPI000992F854|nr:MULTISPECIES: sirohydrochlorin chelatase [Mammaliicoccus]MEB8068527.1 sirohydrochlorin chelatase [Mammaliicoccus fleurettii]OOV76491.1 sirohydrochlorin chelatase [Mammaliicoccus fleurettii]
MIGVLYVSHGSRIKEATEEAITFIDSVKKKIDIPLQEICFLELAQPDIQQGVKKLIDNGATEISVIPVLLLSAGHYFKDIPNEIDEIKKKHPEVTFTYGKPLGVQPRLSAILNERIQETNISIKKDAKLLVVGRGSYNPQTKIDITAIGKALYETTEFENVEVCYLAACEPSFEDALQVALQAEHSQIFIAPYLWFTGVLERHIEKTAKEHNMNSDIIVCKHLGHHPSIQEALKDRVFETLTTEKV